MTNRLASIEFKTFCSFQPTEIQNGDFGALDESEVNQITEIPVVGTLISTCFMPYTLLETIPSYTATDVDAKQYIAGGMFGIVRKGWDKNHRYLVEKQTSI